MLAEFTSGSFGRRDMSSRAAHKLVLLHESSDISNMGFLKLVELQVIVDLTTRINKEKTFSTLCPTVLHIPTSASASAVASGHILKRVGVTWFTLASVHCSSGSRACEAHL